MYVTSYFIQVFTYIRRLKHYEVLSFLIWIRGIFRLPIELRARFSRSSRASSMKISRVISHVKYHQIEFCILLRLREQWKFGTAKKQKLLRNSQHLSISGKNGIFDCGGHLASLSHKRKESFSRTIPDAIARSTTIIEAHWRTRDRASSNCELSRDQVCQLKMISRESAEGSRVDPRRRSRDLGTITGCGSGQARCIWWSIGRRPRSRK